MERGAIYVISSNCYIYWSTINFKQFTVVARVWCMFGIFNNPLALFWKLQHFNNKMQVMSFDKIRGRHCLPWMYTKVLGNQWNQIILIVIANGRLLTWKMKIHSSLLEHCTWTLITTKRKMFNWWIRTDQFAFDATLSMSTYDSNLNTMANPKSYMIFLIKIDKYSLPSD